MTRISLVLIVSVLFALANAMLISQHYALTRDISESPGAPEEMRPYLETIPGSKIRFEMVPIPGGSFVMGSPASEPGRANDEGPQHEVAIRPFWIQALEVTWDEYDLFAFREDLRKDRAISTPDNRGVADAITYPTPPYADESFGYGKGKQPAISMTHHAAMEYCRWLSTRTGKTYRLPTEAEWEYACRAGTKTAYSFGDDARNLGEHAWYAPNSDSAPRAGGKKKPNPWGLYDMHGNVAEWCLDQYDKDFYGTLYARSPALAPVLLPNERRYPRVVRGGSWDDDPRLLRSAARRASLVEWSKRDPQRPQSIWWHTEAITVGFRIVRPLEEQENLKGLRSKINRQSPD
ncbi:MAG TPA: formylglycine-generating enzyme family protein [Blastocatellia bacterium]|nr:formylglycine-generating enzyme family protein [Blastocatellia bacterium]